MPWYVAAFWIGVLSLAAASFRWGGWPERAVSMPMLFATVATWMLRPLKHHFQTVEAPLLAIDIFVAIVFVWVTLRSDRWWPLFATALFAPSLLAHLARVVNPRFHADGYSIAGLTAYLILPVVAVGIFNQRRRARPISASSSKAPESCKQRLSPGD